MKILTTLSVAALVAMPVAANAAHKSTFEHNGQSMTVHYEPKLTTKLRQGGLGPRLMPYCMWEARVSVERTAATADGREISALGRVIPAEAVHKGQANGYCHDMSDSQKAGFVGGADALHAMAGSVAANDAVELRRDLSSLKLLASAAPL